MHTSRIKRRETPPLDVDDARFDAGEERGLVVRAPSDHPLVADGDGAVRLVSKVYLPAPHHAVRRGSHTGHGGPGEGAEKRSRTQTAKSTAQREDGCGAREQPADRQRRPRGRSGSSGRDENEHRNDDGGHGSDGGWEGYGLHTGYSESQDVDQPTDDIARLLAAGYDGTRVRHWLR